ncbi:BQ5605_C008g05340 [Microbotryum silenes-dioicae]|uniref:BQ5605_C008g05340 protein n=1 Tax=Microbotryum silenes-dioicae TaxID=796604 RepID=A0A2X0MGY9_9BASI|nr:BQ5605_C008g05340 [Microbotryum silenes-dioicae]
MGTSRAFALRWPWTQCNSSSEKSGTVRLCALGVRSCFGPDWLRESAFMRRQNWDSEQQNNILVNFTDCVNGTRFNQEQNEQYKMRGL